MITSIVVDKFFDFVDDQISKQICVNDYSIPGYTYNSSLAFDTKIRKKIVLQDADIARTKAKPIWMMKLFSRDALKPSESNARPMQSQRVYTDELTMKVGNQRQVQCPLQVAFISNSPTLIENLEEVILTQNFKQTFTVDFATVKNAEIASLFEGLPPFSVAVQEFTGDSLNKEDTKQYGPIITLTCSVQLHFPLILPASGPHPIIGEVDPTVT